MSNMSNEQKFKICMKRVVDAVNHINHNQKRMNVQVAPPMNDKWGFQFNPVNGDEPTLLIAEYDKRRNGIEWKSTNPSITSAFVKKVKTPVNSLIAISLGLV